ncbi:hypothetical protein [Acaryochloris sp. IP29b_bin.148]|uniref:hypothetical protein n=1 Tax=Acaryochloris sp. IP29b_bin.148 TaxID=2969218 RepID=UPI00260878D6|nr:hypothetical protein [Acaryochloris sp. IP29b_bin.148]
MTSARKLIKAIPLKDKPAGISRCGMSQATFAQHCFTSKWYELSDQGQIVGSAFDLNFYKQDALQRPNIRSTVKIKELSKVL